MKKILLMLSALAICFASCQKVSTENTENNEDQEGTELPGDDIIHFNDQKFLEALLAPMPLEDLGVIIIDKDGDGQITEKEASDVTAMNLYGKEIQNMEEIKYFTSLVVMDCGGNQLTFLDMSNNKALMSLACDNNQLTSLDVRNNTDLSVLHCNGNQLTSLDVSNNTALGYLGCYDNQLTSLDVSNCPELTQLYCHVNPLQTLTISQSQENASWLDDVRQQYPDIEIIVK